MTNVSPATVARILHERDTARDFAADETERANRWRACAVALAAIFTLAMVAMGYAT